MAAGKILANQLRHRLGEELRRFHDEEKLILGICNGFQVLVKLGMLPGLDGLSDQQVTLIANDSNRFEDRWVYLAVADSPSVFLDRGSLLYLPVAHAEGKFVTRDEEVLKELRHRRLVAVRYVDAQGRPGDYPVNPNGSADHIAGICDPTGRVLGLMPHPERHTEGSMHPRWTREGLQDEGDGLALFRNAARFLR